MFRARNDLRLIYKKFKFDQQVDEPM